MNKEKKILLVEEDGSMKSLQIVELLGHKIQSLMRLTIVQIALLAFLTEETVLVKYQLIYLI